jgi:hypothetical protein
LENVTEIIALLRKQTTLESQILNGTGTAIASERELGGDPTPARGPSARTKRRAADGTCARSYTRYGLRAGGHRIRVGQLNVATPSLGMP